MTEMAGYKPYNKPAQRAHYPDRVTYSPQYNNTNPPCDITNMLDRSTDNAVQPQRSPKQQPVTKVGMDPQQPTEMGRMVVERSFLSPPLTPVKAQRSEDTFQQKIQADFSNNYSYNRNGMQDPRIRLEDSFTVNRCPLDKYLYKKRLAEEKGMGEAVAVSCPNTYHYPSSPSTAYRDADVDNNKQPNYNITSSTDPTQSHRTQLAKHAARTKQQ